MQHLVHIYLWGFNFQGGCTNICWNQTLKQTRLCARLGLNQEWTLWSDRWALWPDTLCRSSKAVSLAFNSQVGRCPSYPIVGVVACPGEQLRPQPLLPSSLENPSGNRTPDHPSPTLGGEKNVNPAQGPDLTRTLTHRTEQQQSTMYDQQRMGAQSEPCHKYRSLSRFVCGWRQRRSIHASAFTPGKECCCPAAPSMTEHRQSMATPKPNSEASTAAAPQQTSKTAHQLSQ